MGSSINAADLNWTFPIRNRPTKCGSRQWRCGFWLRVALRVSKHLPDWGNIESKCGKSPKILGYAIPNKKGWLVRSHINIEYSAS